MLALRPEFGSWLTLTAICLISLVRDFRASEIREFWYMEVGFC